MPRNRSTSPRRTAGTPEKPVEHYTHPTAEAVHVPDAGVHPHIKSEKLTYDDGHYEHAPSLAPSQNPKDRDPDAPVYDSSQPPSMEWDTNPAREKAEALIQQIRDAATLDEAKAAAEKLKAMSGPFLNWAGKAERPDIDVPTLPLFVHERHSTQAIIETLKGKRRNPQLSMLDMFGDPQRGAGEQSAHAYEHGGGWQNRLILGDNLQVMNWLLKGEGMGGKVQMVYLDPPYGIKFSSNFQPFVRNREVTHNDDDDLTREPETVQAYRDTWTLGVHTYLTYLRDRLTVARDFLADSGSVFVQIGDENVHRVIALMDEVFGSRNQCAQITFKKTGGQSSNGLPCVSDYIVWYAKDREKMKYRPLFTGKVPGEEGATNYTWIEEEDGKRRSLTSSERAMWSLPANSKVFQPYPMFSQGESVHDKPFIWRGEKYIPSSGSHWKTTSGGLAVLASKNRIIALGKTLRYVNYLSDYPVTPINNIWTDTQISGFNDAKLYVVQTLPKVVQRCVLMTTDPGDLVLDPTCGSGTTAYVAEQWGRRWITIDVSRVPLALTRQRLLSANYDWYKLKDESQGPAGGFEYRRRQNSKGEEVGGIVPHITLGSIANDEPPEEEVLVDRPEVDKQTLRVTGPYRFEASIPKAGRRRPGNRSVGELHGPRHRRPAPKSQAALRRQPDRDGSQRPAAGQVVASASRRRTHQRSRRAGGVLDRPGKRSHYRPAGGEGSPRSKHEGLRPASGGRAEHSTGRQADHQHRRRCEDTGKLPASDARSAHGRLAQKHAVEPGLQRLRAA